MCTLIFLYNFLDGFPIIAMHNRYAPLISKEVPPRFLKGRFNVYSPLDTYSRGSWIGLNNKGLFAAITDQNTIEKGKAFRSRGLLLIDLLTSFSDAHNALTYLKKELTKGYYKKGNFILADPDEAYHVLYDERIEVKILNHGINVFTNLTVEDWMNVERIPPDVLRYVEMRKNRAMELASKIKPTRINDIIERLKMISSDHHGGPGRGSICYHDNRGERYMSSSTIIAISNKLEKSKILYCRGNPCKSEFIDYNYSNILLYGDENGDF
ncbi:MAG: NRDE family protein [Candidatus Bathyarchaeia archaeon]